MERAHEQIIGQRSLLLNIQAEAGDTYRGIICVGTLTTHGGDAPEGREAAGGPDGASGRHVDRSRRVEVNRWLLWTHRDPDGL